MLPGKERGLVYAGGCIKSEWAGGSRQLVPLQHRCETTVNADEGSLMEEDTAAELVTWQTRRTILLLLLKRQCDSRARAASQADFVFLSFMRSDHSTLPADA